MKRRGFLTSGALLASASSLSFTACRAKGDQGTGYADYSSVDEARAKPVLKRELFSDPVILEKVELLQKENNFIYRVRSTEGAEGLAIGHPFIAKQGFPLFKHAVQRWFLGEDARDLDRLVYLAAERNDKRQGAPLAVHIAGIEFAVLDMLGNLSAKPVGELIGEIHHTEVPIYLGTLISQQRNLEPEESLEMMAKQVEETQAKAIKLRGGTGNNLGNDEEIVPGRTEKLLRMAREKFGPDMVLMMDANWSYSVGEAIRIGRIMEDLDYYMFEEPLPWNWYEDQKRVADALDIRMAGGEVEFGMYQFRWLIANDAFEILQPDTFYFSGMIRSMQVAKMAAAKGKLIMPHMSGGGLGYLYMLHLVSALPNAGPFHEFKLFATKDANGTPIPIQPKAEPIESVDGVVNVPTGPGLGVDIDPDYVATHHVLYG